MNSDKQKQDNVEIEQNLNAEKQSEDDSDLTENEILRQLDLTDIQDSLAALQELFEKQIARNQNQTEMFDKVYAEMKDYKESFLLEALHKPIIHNLIQLYDSYLILEDQMDVILTGNVEEASDNLSQHRNNLENFRYKLEEVLYRLDVTPFAETVNTLDRELHKTRQVISTDDPEQDKQIAEVHKIGFYWREKVFRPEEVTIYRYTGPAETSANKLSESHSDVKGENTDG